MQIDRHATDQRSEACDAGGAATRLHGCDGSETLYGMVTTPESYKDNVLTCVSNLPMKSIRHMIFLLPFTDNIMEVQTRSPAKSAL